MIHERSLQEWGGGIYMARNEYGDEAEMEMEMEMLQGDTAPEARPRGYHRDAKDATPNRIVHSTAHSTHRAHNVATPSTTVRLIRALVALRIQTLVDPPRRAVKSE